MGKEIKRMITEVLRNSVPISRNDLIDEIENMFGVVIPRTTVQNNFKKIKGNKQIRVPSPNGGRPTELYTLKE
jgi:hypothetical protein